MKSSTAQGFKGVAKRYPRAYTFSKLFPNIKISSLYTIINNVCNQKIYVLLISEMKVRLKPPHGLKFWSDLPYFVLNEFSNIF